MMSKRIPFLGVAVIPLCASALFAQQDFAVEVRGGASFASSIDQASLDAGDFRLWPEGAGSAARLEVKLFPPIGSPRIRPRLSGSIAPSAEVKGDVLNELSRCPTCYDPFVGEVDRLEATAGIEITAFRPGGSLRSYADVGIGIRRSEFSYESFVGPGGLTYGPDSFSQTEWLGRFALGGGLTFGSRELSVEGVLHASPVGAGTVEVDPVAPFADTEVDYGRETLFDLGITLGLRQTF